MPRARRLQGARQNVGPSSGCVFHVISRLPYLMYMLQVDGHIGWRCVCQAADGGLLRGLQHGVVRDALGFLHHSHRFVPQLLVCSNVLDCQGGMSDAVLLSAAPRSRWQERCIRAFHAKGQQLRTCLAVCSAVLPASRQHLPQSRAFVRSISDGITLATLP